MAVRREGLKKSYDITILSNSVLFHLGFIWAGVAVSRGALVTCDGKTVGYVKSQKEQTRHFHSHNDLFLYPGLIES